MNLKSKISSAQREFVQRRDKFERKHQTIYAFVAGTGLIMFWYGIWEGLKRVPFFGEPLVAIALGGSILLFCGAYAYQLLGNAAAMLADAQEGIEDIVEGIDEVDQQLDQMEDKVEELQK